MQERTRLLKGTTALAIALSAILVFSSGVQAFADSVNNNANAKHLTIGDSTSVGYSIQATGKNGCDVSSDNPVTIALDGVPDGVTVSPDELTFTSCDETQDFTFTATESAVPKNGPYKVTVVVVSGSGIGNLSPGNLNLFIKGPSEPEVVSDTTPPEITYEIDGELGNNDWYVSDVTVTWTVTDPESTVTSTDGCDPTTITEDTEGVTLTCTATSEGGENSVSVTIKRDATNPEITATQGEVYIIGSSPTSDAECDDAMSGISSCDVPTIDASTIGTHSYTVNAEDNAGNTASLDVDYQVNYGCVDGSGFKSPVPNTQYKVGRGLPVKFNACDANNTPIPAVAQIFVDNVAGKSTGGSNVLNNFRFDTTGGINIFNLDTTGLSVGNHVIKAVLDSGQTITATVNFTK
jgi:hypothetical protein